MVFGSWSAYINPITQPGRVASGFKDKDNAVHLQQAEFCTDRLERRSSPEPVPRAQRRDGRAAGSSRLHPHAQRRLILRARRQVRSPKAPSLSGRRRFCCFSEALNGESRASLAAMHGLPKYAWRRPTKTRRSPGTPVRKTFPEQAAMSPAVREPITAHRYRTVIGTLSKDESRSFLNIFTTILQSP